MRKSRYLAVGAALALTIAMGGCAAPEKASDPSTVASEVDGETLRGDAEYDYDVHRSMLGVVKTSETAVTGRITSWAEGRQIQCGDMLDKRAVGEVATDTILAGTGKPVSVFVEVRRGAVVVDADGVEVPLEKGTSYIDPSLQELEAAAPVGTRVIVAAVNATPASEYEKDSCKVVNQGATSAEQLLGPVPQGFILEDGDGNHVSGVADQHDVEWGDWPRGENTFQQILDQLAGING
ncbi:hypothetical protein LJR045_002892 [Microbacterium sp. LjRoot45]|uniref:hypothetical protein n=1 Tax=Microbacterium sp. LjRoot45 TaxID=3342329 RepID=UPI003ECDDFF9